MYDEEFYRKYEKYVCESTVRKNHDWVFGILPDAFKNVIDLGCGKSREFNRFFLTDSYIGVDKSEPNFMDYRKMDFGEFPKFTAFVSLFSTEITAPPQDNYSLYNKIFSLPHVTHGLVSGFYYTNSYDCTQVDECCGRSFQTIDPIHSAKTHWDKFTERRIYMHTPSKLFGSNVIEVWKLFEKC